MYMPSPSMTETSEVNVNNANKSPSFVEGPPPISPELQASLQHIVDDVVSGLGCVGALVATLEMDNSLPVRAYSVSFAPKLLKQIESKLGVSLIGPKAAAYLDNKKFKDNLSVRAARGRDGCPEVVVSDKLHDLFRPVVNKPLSGLAQRMTEIKQIIAVPFFIGDEIVGNLVAASREAFSNRDIDFLTALGRQAAAVIQTQRSLTEMRALERVILSLQASITDETQILQIVVDTVVRRLGYVGAIVATLEADNSLPVRAYAIGFESKILQQIESKTDVSLIGPRAVAYLDDPRFEENLSVRAVKGAEGRPQRFLISDELYDLFRPVVSKTLSDLAQKLTGIKRVMAVPFFLEDEVVGNLFVASRKPRFYDREREILATFAQQAAVGIRNARFYRIAEERRQIAQVFGKMAFSAAANIHALRNHISAPLTYLQLLEIKDTLAQNQLKELRITSPQAMVHLNKAIDILDKLHEPWDQSPDVPSDVNECLITAIRKVFMQTILDMNHDKIETGEGVVIYKSLSENVPIIQTSPDMLTEAFRIIAKNGVEAIRNNNHGSSLWIETRIPSDSIVEILIRDNGIGIKAENLNKIFDLGWSSKGGDGMGFGLFWTKDYIEGLGGKISVESVWKKGTTFLIRLPVKIKKDK